MFDKYITNILLWLHFAIQRSNKECSKKLSVVLFFSPYKKAIPVIPSDFIDRIHVNTGFTFPCNKQNEIVIFRKEEWFKVFIHETIHNFDIDFSSMDTGIIQKKILSFFRVKSTVKIEEAYAETWARLMNIFICSFLHVNEIDRERRNYSIFVKYFDYFLYLEQIHSCFQVAKILNYMELTYNDLINNKNFITKYKEKTNVLAYYIITSILLINYKDFLYFCHNTNNNIIFFKKTNKNLLDFCEIIEKKYKNKNFVKEMQCSEELFYKIKYEKGLDFIKKNLRMSVLEIK